MSLENNVIRDIAVDLPNAFELSVSRVLIVKKNRHTPVNLRKTTEFYANKNVTEIKLQTITEQINTRSSFAKC